jgi:tryptophanyl-tRNA synthetase
MLLLAKPVLYLVRLYQYSSNEYAALGMQLARMLCFAAFASIVSAAFEMTMLWCSSGMQLLRQFAGKHSAAVLEAAALQAADVL